jgi:hypothetical protein
LLLAAQHTKDPHDAAAAPLSVCQTTYLSFERKKTEKKDTIYTYIEPPGGIYNSNNHFEYK